VNVDLVGAPALAWCRGRGRATRADRVKPALVVTLPESTTAQVRRSLSSGQNGSIGPFHSSQP